VTSSTEPTPASIGLRNQTLRYSPSRFEGQAASRGLTLILSHAPVALPVGNQRRETESPSEDPDREDHDDDKDESEDCDRAGVHLRSRNSVLISTS
jgi:hypothetical protein